MTAKLVFPLAGVPVEMHHVSDAGFALQLTAPDTDAKLRIVRYFDSTHDVSVLGDIVYVRRPHHGSEPSHSDRA